MSLDLTQAVLRRDRLVVVASLAALTAIAWAYLLAGAFLPMQMMDMGAGQMMIMPPDWTSAYAGLVLLMWAVMMLAMMLPAAAPVILLAAALARRSTAEGRTAPAATVRFTLGYLAVWFGFSVLATGVQWWLDTSGLLAADTMRVGAIVAGATLVAVGLYQWSPLKQACLRHCRSPVEVFLSGWRDGSFAAFRVGLRHGSFCLGCCWGLMALLFVGGLMNLLWVAGISLLVLVEKVLPWGGRTSRMAGLVLIVWGLVALRAVI